MVGFFILRYILDIYLIAARAELKSIRKPYTQPNNTHPIIVNLKSTFVVAGA